MTLVAIPAWNAAGVLPPVDGAHPASPERSPYSVSLTDFVTRFGQTGERRQILDGFLRYRATFHAAGLTRGFHWLDGSFLERIEQIESRAPNDLDVVTFYTLPAGLTQVDLMAQAPDFFTMHGPARRTLKASFHVDAYLVHLGTAPERLVQQSAYWYSMWAHRRTLTWKGFVQIDLDPARDAEAAAALASLVEQGAEP